MSIARLLALVLAISPLGLFSASVEAQESNNCKLPGGACQTSNLQLLNGSCVFFSPSGATLCPLPDGGIPSGGAAGLSVDTFGGAFSLGATFLTTPTLGAWTAPSLGNIAFITASDSFGGTSIFTDGGYLQIGIWDATTGEDYFDLAVSCVGQAPQFLTCTSVDGGCYFSSGDSIEINIDSSTCNTFPGGVINVQVLLGDGGVTGSGGGGGGGGGGYWFDAGSGGTQTSGAMVVIDSSGDLTANGTASFAGGVLTIDSSGDISTTGSVATSEVYATTVQTPTVVSPTPNGQYCDSTNNSCIYLSTNQFQNDQGAVSLSAQVNTSDGGGALGLVQMTVGIGLPLGNGPQSTVEVIPDSDGGPGFCEVDQNRNPLACLNTDGTVSGSPAVLPNEFVTLSQVGGVWYPDGGFLGPIEDVESGWSEAYGEVTQPGGSGITGDSLVDGTHMCGDPNCYTTLQLLQPAVELDTVGVLPDAGESGNSAYSYTQPEDECTNNCSVGGSAFSFIANTPNDNAPGSFGDDGGYLVYIAQNYPPEYPPDGGTGSIDAVFEIPRAGGIQINLSASVPQCNSTTETQQVFVNGSQSGSPTKMCYCTSNGNSVSPTFRWCSLAVGTDAAAMHCAGGSATVCP